jgi:TM2 domain-containing membrane protein YozV
VSNSYYIAEGGAQRGPFPVEQLVAQGLRPDSLVWAEGMSQWARADEVPALRAMLPGATAQPAPAEPQVAAGADAHAAPQAAPAPAAQLPYTPGQYPPPGYGYAPPYAPADNNKKIAAGICGLLLGGFGVHKFILGLNSAGTIMLCCTLGSWLITLVTCGFGGIIGIPVSLTVSVIGIVEGIIYLTKSDAEFYQLYIVQKKQWF